MNRRAYSLLTIKAVDDAERVIEGIATTPTADRVGDIVEPKGAEFKLPIPLLWQHDSSQPIGWVEEAKVSDAGITIRARFVKIDEPGPLKDRLDEAWQSVKSQLVRGLSIGFKGLEEARIEQTWSYRYLKWLWLELSCVTIPANQDATITAVKSLDEIVRRAASGAQPLPVVQFKTIPGASGSPSSIPKGTAVKFSELIAAVLVKRNEAVARREQIQATASEAGMTKSDSEREEFDALTATIKSLDKELEDLKQMEADAARTTATAVVPAAGANPAAAAAARANTTDTQQRQDGGAIQVFQNIPKGIPFVRLVKSLIVAKGNPHLALMHAQGEKSWVKETPQVIEHLKAAVAGGTTTASGWASQLVYNQNLVDEFIELLRPATVLGKLPGMTPVPFNIRVAGQDSGSTANWVGQGKPIPVSKLNTNEVTLGMAKVAALVVLTKELVKASSPSAEMLVRNDMIKTIATFCDVQFLDPSVAEVANVSPASITNGVTAIAATGTALANLRADVQSLFKVFINANDDPTSCVWIMDPVMALAISLMQNALGQPEHPNISIKGGEFFGLPVIVSNAANITGSPDSGHMIILVKANDIFFADEGGIEVDASEEASIQMLDNPTNAASDGTATTMVSMYQTNSVALRAIRPINWKKRRTTSVQYIKEALYVA